jgi:hypothetical protein
MSGVRVNIPETLAYAIYRCLSIPMWDMLSWKQQRSVQGDDRDSAITDYADIKFDHFNGIPLLMIMYKRSIGDIYRTGFSAAYTLNLNTHKPTKNSCNQTRLPEDIIVQLKKYCNFNRVERDLRLGKPTVIVGRKADKRQALLDHMKETIERYQQVKPVEVLRMTLH